MNALKMIDPNTYIVRIEETARMYGMTRKGLDNLRIKDQTFSKPVALTNSTASNAPRGFIYSEVREWIEKRKAMRE